MYVLEVENESQNDNKKPDSRSDKSRRTRNGNGNCSPRKLEFKKGELFDIPSESNSCRALKFRQAKTRDKNQNVKAECKEKNFRKLFSDGRSIGTDDNSSRIVIRPQAVG